MKRFFLNLFAVTVFVAFLFYFSGCKSTKTVTANDLQKNPDAAQHCDKWQQLYENLSDENKDDLKKNGIVISNADGYLISKNLVADCQVRLRIADYIGKGIGGRNDDSDSKFAREHSSEIVKVLERTWHFYYDGASHEKYNLLHDNAIKDEDIAPFISKLIKSEPLSSDLYLVLLNRPLYLFKNEITESLQKAEQNKNLLQQIYALTLLHQHYAESNSVSKIKNIANNKKISIETKNAVLALAKKMETGMNVDYFDDIEAIELSDLADSKS
ncbi:MAG: hypothetical protein M3209_14825 [Acidobacteriota bacterium]|nr:hypothetical protein [Acidobacteriota bacterium]